MGDICIKCKKMISDDYNRFYHDETRDGEPLFVHGDCYKEDNETLENKIKEILKKSKKPLDCEAIARKLNALYYISRIDSILIKFEEQKLIESV